MISKKEQQWFQTQLAQWHQTIDRPMPWKGIDNPYFIWLSEVILQQTRVEQGWAYYEKFISAYPTVTDLAQAPEDEVLKLWQGLGYYSRARNMHKAAQQIVDHHKGKFPRTYDEILALPGVGPYTAAAIASFAYGLPRAVVDGNVLRVLSRFLDRDEPIDSTQGKKLFNQLADTLLDRNAPAKHNQMMMDFGATVCTPKKPSCANCPLQNRCQAFAKATIAERPVKAKKLKKRNRYLHYFDVQLGDKTLLRKRPEKGIWAGLYEFPLEETRQPIPEKGQAPLPQWLANGTVLGGSPTFKHVLSHQNLYVIFWRIQLESAPKQVPEDIFWVERTVLPTFAVARLMDLYLQQNQLYL